ncbi:MAG: hypothetical protein ACFB2X_20845 [Rivularia sp. (in: cyanobacteria)]
MFLFIWEPQIYHNGQSGKLESQSALIPFVSDIAIAHMKDMKASGTN